MANELTKHGMIDTDWATQRLEQFKKEQEEKKARAGFLKLKPGKTYLRVGPPWKPGLPSAVLEAWLHKLKDPADLKAPPKVTVPCSLKNPSRKPCRVCQRCQELRNNGSKADRELGYQWSAQQRFFSQVVNIEELDAGWQVWEFGSTVFTQWLRITQPESVEGAAGDVTHPVTGRTITVDRTGEGMKDTRYDLRPSMKSTPFPKPELLGQMLDLDQLVVPWDLDKVEAALNGDVQTAPPGDGEVEYTPPKGRE